MKSYQNIELRIGVKAFIQRPDGKYLLVKRSPIRYAFMKDRIGWEIVGGRMEPGCTMFQNLKNEIKAETGIAIQKNIELLFVQDIRYFHKCEKQVVRITFKALCPTSEVVLQTDELSEFGWFSKEEMFMMGSELEENTREVLFAKLDTL